MSKGDEQINVLQARALRAASCRKLFDEAAFSECWDRPGPHRMLDQLREGDTVVVWKRDRLSRSLQDVLLIMEQLPRRARAFGRLTESSSTDVLHERSPAGLAAARAVGRMGWRRKKLDAIKRREIAESVITGRKTGAEMAPLHKVSQPTMLRIVAQQRG